LLYGPTVTVVRRVGPPVVLAVGVIALALALLSSSVPTGIDFHTYEAAARVGLHQGWSHIYDQALVALEQKALVPDQVAQPFISPPPTAWVAALLAPLPYWPSYYLWAALTLSAFALSLLWSSQERGLSRWATATAALAPWWVAQAVHVGQVVPLVAVGLLLAWRLLRERHDLAGGGALALVFLKPNTAFLVPLAFLVGGRFRSAVTWAGTGVVIAAIAVVTMTPAGVVSYVNQVSGPLPAGADSLTLEGALGVTGPIALGLRAVIVAACLAAAFRFRASPGLAIAIGTLGSLLVAPYLHGSDLCLLSTAAFIVWQERPRLVWRVPLAAAWILASPFVASSSMALSLRRWPLIEIVLLAALVFDAWWPRAEHQAPLTGEAELRTRATA
jgi:glycosyl transferase family 87